MTESFSSENFLKLAKNFSNSAYVLSENIEKIGPARFASVLFCAGHSLELSLKAFLIAQGKTEKDLKDFRHDLEKILEACKEYNLPISPDNQMCLIGLNEYYKNHDFRYPNMEVMNLPAHNWTIAVAKEICDLVAEVVSSKEKAA